MGRTQAARVGIVDAFEGVSSHGALVAAVITETCSNIEMLTMEAFHGSGRTSALVVAAAVCRLLEQDCRVINLSMGTRDDHDELRMACRDAVDAGVIVVASSPACGARVFPASYAGVVSATGDARCGYLEFADIGDERARFGASPAGPAKIRRSGGASLAAARVAAELARRGSVSGWDPSHLIDDLAKACKYTGRQREPVRGSRANAAKGRHAMEPNHELEG